MTPAEAALLLAAASRIDNRKPDESAAIAWADALDGLRFEDCKEVIVAHYRSTTDWLMPHHVIAAVRKIRDKRIAEAGDLTPPPDLDPIETAAWLGAAKRRIGDGMAPEDYPGELRERYLPDLRAILPAPTEENAR